MGIYFFELSVWQILFIFMFFNEGYEKHILSNSCFVLDCKPLYSAWEMVTFGVFKEAMLWKCPYFFLDIFNKEVVITT